MALKSFDSSTSGEARQFLADNRSGRKHPKRHRTLKRVKAKAAEKLARQKHEAAVSYASRNRYLAAVRLYWAGITSNHP